MVPKKSKDFYVSMRAYISVENQIMEWGKIEALDFGQNSYILNIF